MIKKTIFAIFTIFVLASCAQTTAPTAFCDLIPKAKIEQLLSSQYTTEDIINLPEGALGCKYISTDNKEKTFNIIARKSSDTAAISQYYQKAINIWKNGQFENRTLKDITDLGDAAFWAYSQKTPQLLTYSGPKLLIITLGDFSTNEETSLNAAKEIANTLFGENW